MTDGQKAGLIASLRRANNKAWRAWENLREAQEEHDEALWSFRQLLSIAKEIGLKDPYDYLIPGGAK